MLSKVTILTVVSKATILTVVSKVTILTVLFSNEGYEDIIHRWQYCEVLISLDIISCCQF